MKSSAGIIIAIIVIFLWLSTLLYLLSSDLSVKDPLTYLMILLQMHLYTGLFITAHDAMHGTVSRNRSINLIIGQICTALYAAFSFKSLLRKHHLHHKHVHSDHDPDYHHGNFFAWYFNFMKAYVSITQLILMAIAFNVLKIWFDQVNILLFWVIPALLSTIQLFYFGTWLPHHGEHTNRHQSRTQSKNHFLAFLTCYFFGYHYEHHEAPHIPWWMLWKMK